MGGTTGEVRGCSKIEAYLRYLELIEQCGDTFGWRIPEPEKKKLCKKEMVQDPNTGEWVLHYRLHT